MEIIGYGEDGLTYWALSTPDQLQLILNALGDDTPREECILFYRPSFGRSGGCTSPQFGEFDAILATKKAVYLIESKWDHMAQVPGIVVLMDVQILRHRIFTWLLDMWQQQNPADWQIFSANNCHAFTTTFPNHPLAPQDSLLARNLTYILRRLAGCDRVRNVLLYFHRMGTNPPQQVVTAAGQPVDPPFELIPHRYEPLLPSGYFHIVH
jgi:hypothetical protein